MGPVQTDKRKLTELFKVNSGVRQGSSCPQNSKEYSLTLKANEVEEIEVFDILGANAGRNDLQNEVTNFMRKLGISDHHLEIEDAHSINCYDEN
ncbi:hypothetical protein QYM36_007587, partial [Artemia franciscana]